MSQSRNAVSNLVARYKAVLKNCHILNTIAAAALAGAVVVGSAGMAMADDEIVADATPSEVTLTKDYTTSPGAGNDFITASEGATELVDWETAVNTSSSNALKALYLMNGFGSYTITGEDTVVTTKGTFSLNDNATITGGGTLDVYGYLTQTAGYTHDISDINVVISTYDFPEAGETTGYTAGKLVLGDELTVGNVTFNDGTGIYLYDDSTIDHNDKWLFIADDKVVTFNGTTIISGADGQSMTFDANGDDSTGYVLVNGELTSNSQISLKADVVIAEDATFTVNNKLTIDYPQTISGGGDLVVNGYLTQTQAGSDISGVDVTINKYEFATDKIEGELVLGNSLTVGNVNFTDGTGIYLYIGSDGITEDTGKVLTIVDGGVVSFADNTYIQGGADVTNLSIEGAGTISIAEEGTLTSDVKIILDDATKFTGGGTLVMSDAVLTQTATGSNLSGVILDITTTDAADASAGIALGNSLTVGDVNFSGDGTNYIALYTNADETDNDGNAYASNAAKPFTLLVTCPLTMKASLLSLAKVLATQVLPSSSRVLALLLLKTVARSPLVIPLATLLLPSSLLPPTMVQSPLLAAAPSS
ncbi:MAG: hypothetical protein R3Y11_06195 [Pseudomonadota bacterium]